MNKNVLKSKLIVAVMLVFGITAFISCEKEEALITDPESDNISVSEWHDKAINSFLETNKFDNTTSREIIRKEIINFLSEENPTQFNKEKLTSNAVFFEKELKKQAFNSLKSTNTPNIVENAISLTDYLVENTYISIELGTSIKDIYTQFGIKDPDSIVLMVNGLKSQNWSDSDILFLNNFVDVFNSSFQLWQEQFDNNTKSTKVSNKEAALIVTGADAVGALYGSIIPIWGSIVEGAVFSAIAILNVVED